MASKEYVDVVIDKKLYSIGCKDGEEEKIQRIAYCINHKIDYLKAIPGYEKNPQEIRTMMMYMELGEEILNYHMENEQLLLRKEKNETEIYSLKNDLVAERMKQQEFEKQLERSQSDLADLQKKLEIAERQAQRANELEAQATELKDKVINLQTELAESKDKAANWQIELAEFKEKAANLQMELTKAKENLTHVQTELTESNNRAVHLQTNLDKSKEQLGDLEAQLTQSEEESEEQLSRLQEAHEAEFVKLKEAYEKALTNMKENYENELSKQKAAAESAQEKLQSAETAAEEQFQAVQNTAKEQEDALTQHINAKNEKINQLNAQNQSLETELAELKNHMDEKVQEEAEKIRAREKEKTRTMQKLLNEVQQTCKSQKQELDDKDVLYENRINLVKAGWEQRLASVQKQHSKEIAKLKQELEEARKQNKK